MSQLKLEKFLPYRLVHLSQTVSKAFYAAYPNEFDLTIPQWRMIALLGQKAPQAALELVASSGMDKVQVSRACDSLSKQGFLSRAIDPSDRRKLQLELTETGKQAHRNYTEIAVAWEKRLLQCLDKEEQNPFDQILNAIFESSSKGKNILWWDSSEEGHQNNQFILSKSYPYRFAILTKLISDNFAEVYKDRFGLTIAEWRLIAILAQYGPISAQETSKFAGLDKVKVSRAIASLQKAKLLNRMIDPSDRRKAKLTLPPKGKRTYQNISKIALAWEKDFVKDLSSTQLDLLDSIISKIMYQSQKILDDPKASIPRED